MVWQKVLLIYPLWHLYLDATLVREKTDGHLLSHVQLENVKNNSDSEAVYSDDFEDEDDSSGQYLCVELLVIN